MASVMEIIIIWNATTMMVIAALKTPFALTIVQDTVASATRLDCPIVQSEC